MGDFKQRLTKGIDDCGLAGRNRERAPRRDDLSLAEVHRDSYRVAVWIDADAIAAGLPYDHRACRCRNLHKIVRVEITHAYIRGALGEPQLQAVVVEVENVEARKRCQANGGRADVKFTAPVAVGPNAIATGQRTIDDGLRPLPGCLGRGEGHCAEDVVEAGDTARRINLCERG